jgi:hypothetical protein
LEELERIEDFEQCQFGQEELIDTCAYKKQLIRKIYRMMKLRRGVRNWEQIKERAMQDCEQYFGEGANVGHLIRFVKQQSEGE